MSKFKFGLIGTNNNGTKIFARLTYDKHTLLRGFYDFDKEKFIIMKYLDDNFPQGITRTKAKKELKENLMDYDWNL